MSVVRLNCEEPSGKNAISPNEKCNRSHSVDTQTTGTSSVNGQRSCRYTTRSTIANGIRNGAYSAATANGTAL